jgi:hypothetical protein
VLTLGVLIVGSPMWLVFLYQSLSVVFAVYAYNISLPPKIDRLLRWVIVSPDMPQGTPPLSFAVYR